MLTIEVPAVERWDEQKEEFVSLSKPQTLTLEHSLVSLSKWEAKWHKPFLSKTAKTLDETVDYIRCMTINKNVPDIVYSCLTYDNFKEIDEYIGNRMSATWFSDIQNQKDPHQIITNEIIYYWMLSLNIPQECERWHLNRLITLIRVTSIKNQPPKKRNTQSILSEYKALNAQRRKEWGTKG